MPLTRSQVEHIAELAKLSLSEQEIAKMTEQLSAILDYAAACKNSTRRASRPPPASSPADVMREDVVEPSLPREDVIANAPDKDDRGEYFRVRAILKGEG